MSAIRAILHPTDFSDASRGAFQLACSLAHDYGARLVLLTVYPSPVTGDEALDWDRADGIAHDLAGQLRSLRPSDPTIDVAYRVACGPIAEEILRLAGEEPCDLIVMGTHGRSGVGRLLMGSVAEAVSRRARCPVATVRAGVPVPSDVMTTRVTTAAAPDRKPDDPDLDLGAGDPCREVEIPAGPVTLRGTLRWIGTPHGVVVFAHGSGSSRHSPRNRLVADALNQAGFATLLLDLLTENEEPDRANVFDVGLLADRLAAAAAWAAGQPETAGLPVGYFGASTGSAAALVAAARQPDRVAALVSRGGRPDLVGDSLDAVTAPTLLIVGGADDWVLARNREAIDRLGGHRSLAVVPGATHLFPEPGALESVAALARDWFTRHLAPAAVPHGPTARESRVPTRHRFDLTPEETL